MATRRDKPLQHPEYRKQILGRREFARRLLATVGFGGGVAYLALAPENWPLSLRDGSGLRSVPAERPMRLGDYRVPPPAGSAEVAVGYGSSVAERLDKALDAVGGLRHYIEPGEIVLVKPNVAFDRSPNLGATTHPEILGELVRRLLVECRAQEVRVADNPIESPADCFAKSGIRRVVERAGGRIYLPDSNAFRTLATPGARLIESWPVLYRPLTNVDKVIGVAPAKDHNLCQASLGIKNWYGLLGGRRNQFHQDIHEIVSDLALMMRPTLTIVDGSRVLMKNGPTGGDPSNVKPGHAVVVGVDPVAVDAWSYRHLLERDDELPAYLRKAEEKGTGRIDAAGRLREIA
ncbi:MAG: DUF362 domain-containing protein [Acidobacteriota bacterium]|nr:DUF362 domain-containing protein [Acidobacteriota bacterium]MDQ7087650.1 DUF362 domain-containing protein [Acidobacteriota bacterium]